MRYPNFFVVGAPKCGTTSLFHYLDQHPEIYIPSVKEPRFFIANHIKNTNDKDPIKEYLIRTSTFKKQDYLDLYKDKKHKILGDASIQYLYHYREVIPQILDLIGKDVKILIMLRNPVDRAFSNYSHNCSTYESLDFKSALDIESQRITEGYNSFWHYKGLSMYSNQVDAFCKAFKNVKIVFFEDFVSDVNSTVSDVYRFLDVDENFKISNYLVNKKNTGQAKSKLLKSILARFKKIGGLKKMAYSIFGKQRVKLINELIDRANLSKKKVKLDPVLRLDLEKVFEQDVFRLQKILSGRNVNWFKKK